MTALNNRIIDEINLGFGTLILKINNIPTNNVIRL